MSGLSFLCITKCPFAIHIGEAEIAGCLVLIVFLMYCDCKCYKALPHGA